MLIQNSQHRGTAAQLEMCLRLQDQNYAKQEAKTDPHTHGKHSLMMNLLTLVLLLFFLRNIWKNLKYFNWDCNHIYSLLFNFPSYEWSV